MAGNGPPAGYEVVGPSDGPPAGYDVVQSATPGEAEQMAKDRFGAMQNSVRDQVPGSASLWTTIKAGLPLDTQKRIQIFANARGIPVDHYGVDGQGNIGFIDPQSGGWVREVPTLGMGSWTGNPVDQFKRLGAQAADTAGPLSSQVAGGGAAAMAPPPLKIPAAGVAAGVVDLGRQALGNYLAGAPMLGDLSYGNAAGQGALAAGGEALGAAGVGAFNRVIGRNTLRASGADIAALRDPANMARYQALAAEARNRGVTLTPGNITDVRSLSAAERQLARQPEGQDAFSDFYRNRNTQQIPQAVSTELRQISPVGSPAIGARMGQQGAQATIDNQIAARSAAASPGYQAAFASGVVPDIQPVLDSIANAIPATAQSSASRRVLTQAYNDLTGMATQRLGGRAVQVRVPIQNYAQMHSAKEAIDNALDTLGGNFNASEITKARAALTPIQEQLTNILRAASPDYEAGYQAFRAASPPIDESRQGLVGLAAQDRTFFQGVPDLIARGDTMSINAARRAYMQNGQGPQWQAMVRSYLTDALSDAMKGNQVGGVPTNVGGKFLQNVAGTPRQLANLNAAIGDPQRVQSFSRLLDVLQAASRSLGEGSATATDLTARKAFASRFANMAATATKGINIFDIPEMAGDAIRNSSIARNAARLAEIYTDDNAMQELARLRVMQPGSEIATRLAAQVLSKYGYLESPALDKPPMVPPALIPPTAQPTGQ